MIGTFDIAMKGRAIANPTDLSFWKHGLTNRVIFSIYAISPSGVEYEVCKITRIASIAQAERGRAKWQSYGLDNLHHLYPTRRKAILNSAAACRFCANPPKAFRD